MPSIKTTYFNVRGLGESQRLLLTYGGEKFEDVRLTQEQWADLKPNSKFGQLPSLEIDGKQYAQSVAISRYLGRKYGLAGDTLEEDLEIDQVVDFFNDIRLKATAVVYEKDPELKATKHAENTKNVYPALLSKLQEIAKKNNGHIALGKLTWADFYIGSIYITFKRHLIQDPELDTKYPDIYKVYETIHALPQLQNYLANRPQTDF